MHSKNMLILEVQMSCSLVGVGAIKESKFLGTTNGEVSTWNTAHAQESEFIADLVLCSNAVNLSGYITVQWKEARQTDGKIVRYTVTKGKVAETLMKLVEDTLEERPNPDRPEHIWAKAPNTIQYIDDHVEALEALGIDVNELIADNETLSKIEKWAEELVDESFRIPRQISALVQQYGMTYDDAVGRAIKEIVNHHD